MASCIELTKILRNLIINVILRSWNSIVIFSFLFHCFDLLYNLVGLVKGKTCFGLSRQNHAIVLTTFSQ